MENYLCNAMSPLCVESLGMQQGEDAWGGEKHPAPAKLAPSGPQESPGADAGTGTNGDMLKF